MISFVVLAALGLRFYGASAAPQTFLSNATAASLPGPAVTEAPAGNCSSNCTYPLIDLSFISWSQMSITATYTAETVVVIVNKKNNATRTTTISNTEIDFGKIATPTNLNSDGTVTASVVDNDGSTRIVAYPTTVYKDYSPNITWTGTLSTTVSGIPTCSIAPTGAVAVFPSHPLLPESVQTKSVDMIEDPRGWTFLAVGERTCGDTGNMIENLFPGLGVWSCNSTGDCVSPAQFLNTALYLTKTSTSTEPDDGPTSKEAAAASTQSPVAHTEITPAAGVPTSNAPPAATSWAPPVNFAADSLVSAKKLLPDSPNPPASATNSIIITPSPAPVTIPPTPVPVPDSAPAVQEQASNLPPVIPNPPAPATKSVVITPSPAPVTTLPTTPVAVAVPVTSTDSQGSVTISTSTAIAHPIIISSTNAQGSLILSTSLSTAAISASLPTIITSINAQGVTLSSTIHLPAIILTTTNAAGSKLLTTSALSAFTPAASGPVPLTINSETITQNAQSQYIISSQTLAPGSSITLGTGPSATVLALQTTSGTTALVYSPHTSLLPSAAAPLTIGSETLTPNANSQYLIAGSTLAPGSSITLGTGPSATVLALETTSGTTALVYGPRTSLLPFASAPLTIGAETITPNANSQYIISSQTLAPGSSITLGTGASATILALQTTSGTTALVYSPHTSLLPPSAAVPLTIGSETITPNANSQYIIAGSTLVPGSTITLGTGPSATILALETTSGTTALVFAASTSTLPPPAPSTASPPAITIGSETVTANSQTQYVITGTGGAGALTLTPGGVVTVGGTRVSLAAGASDVVVGSSTEALGPFITAGFGAQAFTGGGTPRGCGCGAGWWGGVLVAVVGWVVWGVV